MKQRFSKRTRLVSALLTLAMVFTFLPFSAFAADIKSVDKLAFTTNGCDALQIEEGAQASDWLASFKAKMNQTDFSQLPLVAVEGYGFSINMYVSTLGVVNEDGTNPGTFSKGNRYFLELLILPRKGYGDSVGRMPMYGVSNEGPWDSVTLSSISFVAKSEAESTEINNIYLTIPAPEAGKTAAEWEDKTQKTDSRYRVKLYWAEVDEEGNVLSDLSTGKFVEGKRYRVCAELYTKTGYYFPDIQNQIAVINGEEIAAEKNPYGQNNTQWRNYFAYLTAVSGGSTGGGGTVTPPEPPVTPPEPPVTPPSGGGSAGGSGGSDGGAGIAVLAIGGVAVAGLVGYGVYSYVSEQQLKALLPEGVAVPENRAQTALLLWNTAGRPEPAAQPAFPDVADPDTAKAAQWCVEQGLMNLKFRGRFAPDGSSPAYKTLNAYRQLVG